jgi:hypothetical protein
MIIQNPLLTGSLNYNGADLSNVTSSNANSASVSLILTAVSSSNQQLSASYIALSASYNVFSGSASTRITTVSASQQDISSSLLQVSASYIALSGSYNIFSGSASTRVTKIENNYATTGSNSFRADQSITGSLVVSSTITAQTLVVQTVTSSIVYSSGSNLFGNQLANTQTFTGSVNITGSLALAGNITGNAITLTGALSGTSATFTGTLTATDGTQGLNIRAYTGGAGFGAIYSTGVTAGAGNFALAASSTQTILSGVDSVNLAINSAIKLAIASTGAATFSSSVTANIINSTSTGSTQLFLKSTGGGSNRDWQFQTSETAAGDLSIMQSTTAGGATYATKLNITSGGNVLIGNTTDYGHKLQATGVIASIGNAVASYHIASATTYGWYNGGSTLFYLTNSGVANVGYYTMSTGNYTATSDINKKKDIELYNENALNKILLLKPSLYRMKTDNDFSDKHIGFIAQEVKYIFPQAYSEATDNDETFIGLEYTSFTPLLVKAIQELSKQNEELSNRLIKLENK